MNSSTVCVIGGSGFVGRHLCQALVNLGYQVRVPSREPERARNLLVLPTVELIRAQVHDDEDLRRVVGGCDAVVNLVGILHERRSGPRGDFVRVHVDLPRRVVAACRARGVPRLLHMSALAADVHGPSAYLRSKGQAEEVVRAAVAEGGPATTVFRPSVIFGPDDAFLNLFAGLMEILPVMLVACPDAQFQPVHVDDVARAMAMSVDLPATAGQTYDLAGPRIYTLRELLDLVGRLTGHGRPMVGLGRGLSLLQARFMELLPTPLMTRDNVLSMDVPNVSPQPFPPVFGFLPRSLEETAPLWLAARNPRARYRFLRSRAGR